MNPLIHDEEYLIDNIEFDPANDIHFKPIYVFMILFFHNLIIFNNLFYNEGNGF